MKEDNKKEIKIFRGGGPERYGPERHTSLRTVSFTRQSCSWELVN